MHLPWRVLGAASPYRMQTRDMNLNSLIAAPARRAMSADVGRFLSCLSCPHKKGTGGVGPRRPHYDPSPADRRAYHAAPASPEVKWDAFLQ
jgi:hypothetical protein